MELGLGILAVDAELFNPTVQLLSKKNAKHHVSQ